MISVDKISVMNLENALRGARNPLNSWDKSDSRCDEEGRFVIGAADLALAKKLCRAGSDHRKFLRQIFVSLDICAPMYWWKEFDTYKVGTVSNSTSTMHKIHSVKFDVDQFSCDHMSESALAIMSSLVEYLEVLRVRYLETKSKSIWYEMIQLLPSSYNQLRTCTLNYEVLSNIYAARKNHKLDEWRLLCDIIGELPYAKDLIVLE